MYYSFKDHPIVNPSNYQGDSFRSGNYWYKVIRHKESFERECQILKTINTCNGTVKMHDFGDLVKTDTKGHVVLPVIKEEFIDGLSFQDYARTTHNEEKGIQYKKKRGNN